MSEFNQESLSALLDDEADELALPRLLKLYEDNPEIIEKWRRFSLVQSIIRDEIIPIKQGFMEGVPRNIGRQGEEARQTAELVAENFSADSEEEWLANIQNRYTDLAKTKHLTYNYGDDYYSRGRRFINMDENIFFVKFRK